MNHPSNSNTRPVGRGFTLVEVLVVIAIIAVLAVVVMGISKNLMSRAAASKRLSDIRQGGTMLLGIASEDNGRCTYQIGNNGFSRYYPYFLLQDGQGRDSRSRNDHSIDFMHWDIKKLRPKLCWWNCRGVNIQNVTFRDGSTVKWTVNNDVPDASGPVNLRSLSLSAIPHPELYPLLIDSSQSTGNEIFFIHESLGYYVGLRESGKAGAFLFDGSVRYMGKAELKKAGFTRAYDNSTTPPKPVDL